MINVYSSIYPCSYLVVSSSNPPTWTWIDALQHRNVPLWRMPFPVVVVHQIFCWSNWDWLWACFPSSLQRGMCVLSNSNCRIASTTLDGWWILLMALKAWKRPMWMHRSTHDEELLRWEVWKVLAPPRRAGGSVVLAWRPSSSVGNGNVSMSIEQPHRRP